MSNPITPTTQLFLLTLYKYGTCTKNEILSNVWIDKGTVSRYFTRLVESGHIEMVTNDISRGKEKSCKLTSAGKEELFNFLVSYGNVLDNDTLDRLRDEFDRVNQTPLEHSF